MNQPSSTHRPENPANDAANERASWWDRLVWWREKHLPEKTFVVILALVVGIASGLAAVLLKTLIHVIASFLTSRFSIEQGNLLYLVFPAIGILLASMYVYYIAREPISHGVTRVLYAVALKKSRLKVHNMYSSLIASSLTIGEVGLWHGVYKAGKIGDFENLWYKAIKDCDYIKVYDENGHLYLTCSHHDGTCHFEIKEITPKGREYLDRWEWGDDNRTEEYTHNQIYKRYSKLPRYAEKVMGCKAKEYIKPTKADLIDKLNNGAKSFYCA